MKDNEDNYSYEQKDSAKIIKSKKFHGFIRTYTQTGYKHDSIASSEQS